MKKDSLIYTVTFSFIITFVFVFILAVAYEGTAERVKRHQKISETRAYLSASGIKLNPNEDPQVKFSEIFGGDFKDKEVLTAKINNENIFLSRISGKGLWGTISGVIAVNSSIDKIIGIEITSHSETPGLGGRIEESWFLNQFRDEKVPDNISIIMGTGRGDTVSDNGLVDGITGATRTSESVENIINKKLLQLRNLKRRGEI
ncbi:FMN-binding protein [Ilyobacter polytropus]|uniref:FMN-binding domain protein n=1 Tax=Ilyobacter polytropus (strain ATCC 51220 / DSM 2926 / LMG 16218 / CuHBu1) TaxID=572544 RepID=E3HBG1_ILYPC|nr:FMN-binding protein [Ilyobacter polytropus]ADO83776.1 FMN-binding domain protein [Ilyobacter polytropus DSM 2926]